MVVTKVSFVSVIHVHASRYPLLLFYKLGSHRGLVVCELTYSLCMVDAF